MWGSFFIPITSLPSFIKIRRCQDFLVLIWHGTTHRDLNSYGELRAFVYQSHVSKQMPFGILSDSGLSHSLSGTQYWNCFRLWVVGPSSSPVCSAWITLSYMTNWLPFFFLIIKPVKYRTTGFNCVFKSLRFQDFKVIANLNIAFVWHMSYYLNRSGYPLVLVLGTMCLVRRSE